MTNRERIVKACQKCIGIAEGSTRHKALMDLFNTLHPDGWYMGYHDAWCAAFASAIAMECGLGAKYPLSANCGTIVDKARKMGIWVENDAYVPTAGDWIIYYWNDDGKGDCNVEHASHVGVVEKVVNNVIYVIEGNWNRACARRQIAVNGRYIRGYVHPKLDPVTIHTKGITHPDKLIFGNSFNMAGTIDCSSKIARIEAGVVQNGKWTAQKYDKKINSKTFDLKKAGTAVKFAKLKAGNYFYRIWVWSDDGAVKVFDEPFTVSYQPATITVTGASTPVNLTKGTAFDCVGTITSNQTITRVEIGVVDKTGKKWTAQKYDKAVNAKSFKIGKASSSIGFRKLAAGTYYYRIWVHTIHGGAKMVKNSLFTITAPKVSVGQAAVDWAKKIAADNSFSYGYKPTTSAWGCYFCGTNGIKLTRAKKYNQYKGDSRWYKTYVCLSFLGAAYAHGAKLPLELKYCKEGNATMYSNWSKQKGRYGSEWQYVGKCKDVAFSSLKVGDILVTYSKDGQGGHVVMYCGGDYLVEAWKEGFTKDSIAYHKGAKTRLKTLSANANNFVMRPK